MTNGENNAFPVVLQHGLTHDCHVEIGLTKREYFAAMAMQGLLANHRIIEAADLTEIEYIKRKSVTFADALLSELEKTKTT